MGRCANANEPCNDATGASKQLAPHLYNGAARGAVSRLPRRILKRCKA
jgi:hypothetical protein